MHLITKEATRARRWRCYGSITRQMRYEKRRAWRRNRRRVKQELSYAARRNITDPDILHYTVEELVTDWDVF